MEKADGVILRIVLRPGGSGGVGACGQPELDDDGASHGNRNDMSLPHPRNIHKAEENGEQLGRLSRDSIEGCLAKDGGRMQLPRAYTLKRPEPRTSE